MNATCTLALVQDRASPHWILSDVLKEGQDVRWHLGEIPSGRCEEIGKNGPDKGLSLVGGYG